MLESGLIEHCAPTLAGLKSANLFNYYFDLKRDVFKELREVNQKLNERGVYIEPLLWKDTSVLIYVYRKTHLQQELKQTEVIEFLSGYGYTGCEIRQCINRLKERLKSSERFPHEIGVFLGYPLGDVIGFIQNEGRNCKCCGMWKVYDNENEAQKLFFKLQKCTNVYVQLFAQGRSIVQMTISA